MSTRQGTHTTITKSEFESFLEEHTEFNAIPTASDSQIIYEIDLPKDNLAVRILSTIERNVSRPYAQDSIKIMLWHRGAQTVVGEKKRAYRVDGWKSNIQEKIEDLVANYRNHVFGWCDECGDACIKSEIGPFKTYLDCATCNFSTEL